jgi:hypothetical protein
MGFSSEGIDEGSGPKIALAWLMSTSSALAAFTVFTEKATMLKAKSVAKSFRINFVKMSLAMIMTVLLELMSGIVAGTL